MRTVSANLKTHLAAETQTLATCFRLTLTGAQPTISNVTAAGSPSIVTITTTYAHRLVAGDVVQIVDVADATNSPAGITGLNYAHDSNDVFYPVLTAATTTFTIADPGISGTYVSGGEARKCYGTTNIDKDILLHGMTYKADNGSVPSALRTSIGMQVGTFDNQGIYSDANISEQDILLGRVDYAEVESFVCNYESLTDGKMILAFGYMGQLKLERNTYIAEFSSLSSVLAQDTIRILSPDCPYDLGDSDCGLDVAGSPSFTFTGSVAASATNLTFTDTGRTEADGYFDGGLLTWTSGANAGLQGEIKDYVIGTASSPVTDPTFTFYEAMPFDISVSPQDTYSVVAGCGKSASICKTKFNNIVNFGGFNFLPGMSQISSVGGQRK